MTKRTKLDHFENILDMLFKYLEKHRQQGRILFIGVAAAIFASSIIVAFYISYAIFLYITSCNHEHF